MRVTDDVNEVGPGKDLANQRNAIGVQRILEDEAAGMTKTELVERYRAEEGPE